MKRKHFPQNSVVGTTDFKEIVDWAIEYPNEVFRAMFPNGKILNGLSIDFSGNQITIGKGTALDNLGQVITVLNPETVNGAYIPSPNAKVKYTLYFVTGTTELGELRYIPVDVIKNNEPPFINETQSTYRYVGIKHIIKFTLEDIFNAITEPKYKLAEVELDDTSGSLEDAFNSGLWEFDTVPANPPSQLEINKLENDIVSLKADNTQNQNDILFNKNNFVATINAYKRKGLILGYAAGDFIGNISGTLFEEIDEKWEKYNAWRDGGWWIELPEIFETNNPLNAGQWGEWHIMDLKGATIFGEGTRIDPYDSLLGNTEKKLLFDKSQTAPHGDRIRNIYGRFDMMIADKQPTLAYNSTGALHVTAPPTGPPFAYVLASSSGNKPMSLIEFDASREVPTDKDLPNEQKQNIPAHWVARIWIGKRFAGIRYNQKIDWNFPPIIDLLRDFDGTLPPKLSMTVNLVAQILIKKIGMSEFLINGQLIDYAGLDVAIRIRRIWNSTGQQPVAALNLLLQQEGALLQKMSTDFVADYDTPPVIQELDPSLTELGLIPTEWTAVAVYPTGMRVYTKN